MTNIEKVRPKNTYEEVVLTFKAGLNTHVRHMEIDLDECLEGENFALGETHHHGTFRRRRPFDLVATAPIASAVSGYGQKVNTDGSVSTLIQVGSTVYSWDGASTFTSVGTVLAGTKLRGPRQSNFTLDGYVIMTDLAKIDVVKKWDGTTFSDLAHNLGTTFIAKYCRVSNERAFFANVMAGGVDTPHVILGSALDDAQDLTTTDRPSSALSTADPFFIPMPNLRPINGLEEAFGQFIISTERDLLYRLSGQDATDFAMESFYQGSAVAGDEAIANIGNDVILASQGRIETLSGTLNFGDVETNDVSRWIAGEVSGAGSWTVVYDRRYQKVLCFPDDQGAVWVLHKTLLNSPDNASLLSPWSKWTTTHALSFQPTCVMPLIDPTTGTDAIYMGDSTGNIYRLDGDGGQDGGTADVTVSRTSGIARTALDQVYGVSGWIQYHKQFAATVTLTFEFSGVATPDQVITIPIPANDQVGVYGGGSWYGLGTYYGGGFHGKLFRRDFRVAGRASQVQVTVEVEGEQDVEIEEVGIRFHGAET